MPEEGGLSLIGQRDRSNLVNAYLTHGFSSSS